MLNRIRNKIMPLVSGYARDQGGATAVEFAMTVPLLVMIVLGTIEFGRAIKAQNEMSHVLSTAVRLVNLDPSRTTSAIASYVETKLDDYTSEELSISVANTTQSGNDFMRITVTFPFEVIVPFSPVSTVNLSVDTLAPLMAPTS